MTHFKTPFFAAMLVCAAPIGAEAQPQKAETAAPFVADAVISVNGLVCDFCAQAIEKSFRRRAEVAGVRVDLTAKTVSLDFKPGQTLDEATIRQIVTRAGYTMVALRRTGGGA